jgi:PAT family beta-lactamase induction signal transducer AmpG
MDRKLLPTWLLGLANAPLGLVGGLTLLTLPQLLAARHVPEAEIAQLTTLALVPSFIVFLLGPIVDVRFRRRTYAAGASIVAAAGVFLMLLLSENLRVLGALMFIAMLGSTVNSLAIGGWLGSLLDKDQDARLGAWMTAANVGGFGLIAMAGIQVLRALPTPLAAAVLAAPNLLPLLIYAVTPAPPPDQRLMHESFGRFMGDLAALVRQPKVLQLLLLFAVPAASFALTNTLGGLGHDYGASEAFVAFVGGSAATVAGLFGALIVAPLGRRMDARMLYLSVAVIGAAFTLSLIVLPRTPTIFGVAMIGQNLAQSAALSLNFIIALQSLGKNNPFAATQFGLIVCAAALPITYMQWLDGHAYGRGGLTLMYLVDGGAGLLAAIVMIVLLRLWRTPAESDEPAAAEA